jgi:hypothetical protein
VVDRDMLQRGAHGAKVTAPLALTGRSLANLFESLPPDLLPSVYNKKL